MDLSATLASGQRLRRPLNAGNFLTAIQNITLASTLTAGQNITLAEGQNITLTESQNTAPSARHAGFAIPEKHDSGLKISILHYKTDML